MARPRCTKMADCPVPPSIAHDHVPMAFTRPSPIEGKRVIQLSEFGKTPDEARKNAERLVSEGLIQYVGKRSFSLTEAGERKEQEHRSARKAFQGRYEKTEQEEADEDVAGDNEVSVDSENSDLSRGEAEDKTGS